MPTPPTRQLWRVFPWDPAAPAGAPFSPSAIPVGQGSGRFDVPHLTPIRYLAESPDHAVGERIQTLRGQALAETDLEWHGRRLALIAVEVVTAPAVIDLCDPQELVRYGCRPDELASRDLVRTQAIAARLYATGAAGFRWWSSLLGDWHTTVLFANRLSDNSLHWGHPPVPLTLDHPAVRSAAAALGIGLAGSRSASRY